jgi:hypothetical protein
MDSTESRQMMDTIEVEAVYQHLASLPKHAGRAQKALERLEAEGINTLFARDALAGYREIERSDYDDAGEYQDARNDAWEAFLEELEGLED